MSWIDDQRLFESEVTSLGDIAEMDKAKEVGEALCQHYPGHLWVVAWQGGALVVKNLILGARYGMILDGAERYSASAMKADAVMKAGELLERCGMERGAWNGEIPQHLEGADPNLWMPADSYGRKS